jgi:hypothetical protein
VAAGGSHSQCGRQSNLRTWSERVLHFRWREGVEVVYGFHVIVWI